MRTAVRACIYCKHQPSGMSIDDAKPFCWDCASHSALPMFEPRGSFALKTAKTAELIYPTHDRTPPMEALDDLAQQWRIAKEKEESAKQLRIFIEGEILKMHPAMPESSYTIGTPAGAKIKIAGRMIYKADIEALMELTDKWDADARPIKTKVELDESKLRVLRAEAPRLWSEIAPAVTVTPAKVGVSIEFKQPE